MSFQPPARRGPYAQDRYTVARRRTAAAVYRPITGKKAEKLALARRMRESCFVMSELPMRSRQASGMARVSPLRPSRQANVAGELDRAPTSTRMPLSSPMRTSAPLLETPYCSITWDARNSIVRFVRSNLAYATIADIEREGREVERALQKAGKVRLLIDLRAVTPRNDAGFEVAIVKLRSKLLGGGQQIAILVQTAIGALQVKRHMREDGFAVEVFTQEEEALAFLDMRVSERAPRSSQAPLSRTTWSRPMTLSRVG